MRSRFAFTAFLVVAVAVAVAAIAAWWFVDGRARFAPEQPGETGDATPPSALPAATESQATLAGQRKPAERAAPTSSDPARSGESEGAGRVARLRFVGRVVDARRIPVAGATVTYAGERLNARAATTDAAGWFRIEPSGRVGDARWVRGLLRIDAATASGALATIHEVSAALREDEDVDLGTIELHLTADVLVHVSRVDAKPVGAARVELYASGLHETAVMRWGEVPVDAAGDAPFRGLPLGWANVLVRADDGTLGFASAEVSAEPTSRRIGATLRPARGLDVLVVSDTEPALPIAGVRIVTSMQLHRAANFVEFVPFALAVEPAPTGTDGRTRVEGLVATSLGAVHRFVAELGERRGHVEPKPSATQVTITLASPGAPGASYAVVAGKGPVPPAGTRLVIVESYEDRGTPAAREGRIGGEKADQIVLPDFKIERGLAIAPDGSIAPLGQHETTEFAAPRRVTLRLTETGGKPVAGVELSLCYEKSWTWSRRQRTDAQGRAVFEGMPPWTYVVHGFTTARDDWGHELGAVDATKGDALTEIVVGREAAITVRVSVSGQGRLPAGLEVGIDAAVVTHIEEDGAAGDVRLRARAIDGAETEGALGVGGRGLRWRRVPLSWPVGTEPVVVDVSLDPKPEVFAIVRASAGQNVFVFLERWIAERGAFSQQQGVRSIETAGRTRLDVSQPGRYRLHEVVTGIVSEPFEVSDDARPVETTIDLVNLYAVRGRVETPAGPRRGDVFVVVEAPGVEINVVGYRPGRRVSADGTFEVKIPLGQRATLRPRHDTLRPAAGEAGATTVDGPRDGVVLRLVDGPRASLRIANTETLDEATRAEILGASTIWERLLSAKPDDWTHQDLELQEDGSITAGGLVAGDAEIWIDVPLWAPLRLEKRTLVDGMTALGELRLERGSHVRIRARSAKGRPPTEVRGEAERLGEPAISRETTATGNADSLWSIPGLSAGTWKVTLRWTTDRDDEREFERAIEIDGEKDVTLDVETD